MSPSCAFSCLFLCCFGLACFLLAASSPPSCPPSRLVPWYFLVQSVLWSLPPGIWLYLATVRLSCLVVWSVVMSSFLSSLSSWQQRLRPCETLPSTPCCGCCSGAFLPALRYSPSGDPEPLWTPLELHAPTCPTRAAFSPPVLCCLPWRLLPLAAAGSACFLPSRPCSH